VLASLQDKVLRSTLHVGPNLTSDEVGLGILLLVLIGLHLIESWMDYGLSMDHPFSVLDHILQVRDMENHPLMIITYFKSFLAIYTSSYTLIKLQICHQTLSHRHDGLD